MTTNASVGRVEIPDYIRMTVLNAASAITTLRSTPEAVAANAWPLFAWLAAAADDTDLDRRYKALRQQVFNRIGTPEVGLANDDPQRLIAEARVLYDVLTRAA